MSETTHADGIKFLRILLGPHEARGKGRAHDWHDCDRCRAFFDLESKQPYAVRLVQAVVDACEAGARQCAHCAHANHRDADAGLIVCTCRGGYYNGKLMEATSRCAEWEAEP